MLDEIFGRDAPEWVHLLFGQQDKEITKQLKAESVLYAEKMQRMRQIYAEYPEFVKLMESEELEEDLVLSIQDGRSLSELITTQADIMGMYQKLYFYKGVMMAMKMGFINIKGKRKRNNMKYTEFCENVKEKIKAYLPVGSNTINVEIYEALKANGVKKVGIVFEDSKGEAQPAIYLEEFYREFQNGTSIEKICKWISEIYQEAIEARPDKRICNFYSFEDVCDKISMRLVNYDYNEKFLTNGVPHMRVEDLGVYYNIHLHTGKNGMASVVIREEMLNAWGVSLEEVHDKAKENTLRILQPKLCGLTDMISGEGKNLLETNIEEGEKEVLYTLAPENGKYGAAVILFPELMEKVEKLIGEYYILPSSLHEVIVVDKESTDPVMLGRMVREINMTQVEREDWLSHNVYEFVKGEEGSCIKIVEEAREEWDGNK